MENTEIDTFVTVEVSQVPAIIQEQFNGLHELRANITEASQKADDARASAESAREKSAGVFGRKEAIRSLQEATVDLADAQISAAQAQEISFEYNQKLAEVIKYLFGLGVSNLAMNRSVVRELELRLQNASEEELDELARKELVGVVRQLKAQEDIMAKQANLSARVKEHEDRLETISSKTSEQDEELARQAEINAEHDRQIASGVAKDIEQDAELSRQAR